MITVYVSETDAPFRMSTELTGPWTAEQVAAAYMDGYATTGGFMDGDWPEGEAIEACVWVFDKPLPGMSPGMRDYEGTAFEYHWTFHADGQGGVREPVGTYPHPLDWR